MKMDAIKPILIFIFSLFFSLQLYCQNASPELVEKLNKSFSQRTEIIRNISQLERKISKLEQENKEKTQEYEELESDYNFLQDRLTNKEELISALKSQMDYAYKVIGTNSEELKKNREQTGKLVAEMGILQADLDIISNEQSGFKSCHGVGFNQDKAVFKVEIDMKTGNEIFLNPKAFKGSFDFLLYEIVWIINRSERNMNWTEIPGIVVIYEDNNFATSFATTMNVDKSFKVQSKLKFKQSQYARQLDISLKRNKEYKFAFIPKLDYDRESSFIEDSSFWISCKKGLFLFATEDQCEYKVNYISP